MALTTSSKQADLGSMLHSSHFIRLFKLKVVSHQSLYCLVLKYYTIYTIQVHHAMLTSRPLLRRCAVVIVNHNDYRRNTSLRIALLVLLALLENTRDL
jgi:hypothetical protein